MRLTIPTLLSLLSIAAPAYAAPTPAQLCESAMELASAKYAQCRLNAESKDSKAPNPAKRTEALGKCSDKLSAAFQKATLRYGAGCAATETSSAFDDYLKQCSDDTAAAAAGAALITPQAKLLKTGQTTSYGTGTDGDLQLGVAHGFVDNGDGTITDTSTGLMWEKKSDDGSIHDKDNFYAWSGASYGSTNVLDGTVATTFLAGLNAGGGFAEHSDWRLPNLKELHSLINLEIAAPVPSSFPAFNTDCGVNSSGNPGCTVTTCSCTVLANYWSSSTYANAPSYAWVVAFWGGVAGSGNKLVGDYYVRAVRGGS